MDQIDFEKITLELIANSKRTYSGHELFEITNSMKQAVKQALPIVLKIAAEKAKVKYTAGGVRILKIDKGSITSLEAEIIKEIGL